MNLFSHIVSYLSESKDVLATKVPDDGFVFMMVGGQKKVWQVVNDGRVLEHMVEVDSMTGRLLAGDDRRSEANSSEPSVNFWSRSRMRKRTGSGRSAKVHVSCRTCWVTHGALGFGVHPARCTRRLHNSMKNSTYTRWSQIVSTVKKSTANRLCRADELAPSQPRRVPAGPSPAARSHVRTVVAETTTRRPLTHRPSVDNPHRGFSRARRITSARISARIGGRPIGRGYVHRFATKYRCTEAVWPARR